MPSGSKIEQCPSGSFAPARQGWQGRGGLSSYESPEGMYFSNQCCRFTTGAQRQRNLILTTESTGRELPVANCQSSVGKGARADDHPNKRKIGACRGPRQPPSGKSAVPPPPHEARKRRFAGSPVPGLGFLFDAFPPRRGGVGYPLPSRGAGLDCRGFGLN